MTVSTTTSMLMTPEPFSPDVIFSLKSQHFLHPSYIQLLNGHFLSDSTNPNGILHLSLKTCCLCDFSSFYPSLGIKTLASTLMPPFLPNSHIQDSEALTLCALESEYLGQWIGTVPLIFTWYMVGIALLYITHYISGILYNFNFCMPCNVQES